MIVDIIAKGSIYGNEVTFRCEPNREGLYELARITGRKAGSRPQHQCNKVFVETKEQALEMLKTNDYYIALTARYSGIHRKSLRPLNSCSVLKR
ncbi:hypothetical protein EK599_19080 [Vibrio sp. T187]|uniref:hypothetical protein n=1 Tax=Vibrio TaxID=662 RepID=UPI0010C97C5C|nr:MULTISPECIES: hypothetical protein [Vibrio]MBW3697789.1 hypothetical protein [Vibrio sp. T187]